MTHRQMLTVVSVLAAVFLAGFLLGQHLGHPGTVCHASSVGKWCKFQSP